MGFFLISLGVVILLVAIFGPVLVTTEAEDNPFSSRRWRVMILGVVVGLVLIFAGSSLAGFD